MGNALLAGVSGMKAHQKMIDVSGNNLANLNTNAFKSSRVTFATMLAETLREASTPTASQGGTNPMQVGSGATIRSIDRNMTHGSMINTGKPLDMAIEGEGYFVLNDGESDQYTRVGAFAVDAQYYLVDPATGCRVQRIGNTGVNDGFQSASSKSIRIPYDVALPANSTENITFAGNLSADENDPTTHLLSGGLIYTTNSGQIASGTTTVDALDQADGVGVNDQIRVTGTDWDAATETATPVDTLIDIHTGAAYKDMDAICTEISALFTNATATIVNGDIRLTEDAAGYSQNDINLTFVPDAGNPNATLETPAFFKLLAAGGEVVKETSIEVYDTQGIGHVINGAFVRHSADLWDFVASDVGGTVTQISKRRVASIAFDQSGAYNGVPVTENRQISVEFPADAGNPQAMTLDLGVIGEYNGLSQFGGASTATASSQDGFASGWLSNLSVSREGVLVGVFTNGVRKDVAAIKLATFQNPAALLSLGGNYFATSSNSGVPQETNGLASGAGAVRGGALEGSNVDVAEEFVGLIQAQNGFQANARTIRVSTDMLKELTNLIR
ncbi:MAG: flagellar hook protein FlgE [Planctomycetota bacterium]|jgi:flagellar hook protein FlgE